MKRKPSILLFAMLTCLSVLGFAIGYALLPTSQGITREVTDRIQLGMNAAEVEAIMGMPPGFYRDGMVRNAPGRQRFSGIVRADNDKVITASEVMHWYLDGVVIEVYLDEDERVVWCEAHFQSLLSRIGRSFNRLLPGKW